MKILKGLLFAIVLAPAVAWAGCGADVKQKWSGSGMITTRPFHMDTPWEIQWTFSAKPMVFQIMVYSKGNDDMPNIAANQMDATPGSSYQPRAGDFYLTFNTTGGNWTACVVPVPD